MVRVMVEMPGDSCKEFAIIELQGDLETRHPVPLSGKFIGDLHFTNKDTPVLIIGHHILHGKVVSLDKPLCVLSKKMLAASSSGSTTTTTATVHDDMDTGSYTVDADSRRGNYSIQAVIRKKLVFKTRPKPIIAHVPKKI